MKRILRATAMALSLALALPAYAAVDATLVTRSGERIAGSLVDFGAGGVTIRVSGQTRTFRIDELAVIDFTNASSYPANELERANNGSHVLVLRNGSVLGGRLADIGGSAPLRITFVEGGATRDFSSDEVARIYFASPTGSRHRSQRERAGRNRTSPRAGDERLGSDRRDGETGTTDRNSLVRRSTAEQRPCRHRSDGWLSEGPVCGKLAASKCPGRRSDRPGWQQWRVWDRRSRQLYRARVRAFVPARQR